VGKIHPNNILEDDFCMRILTILLLSGEKELQYSALQIALKTEMSKPTLSLHLKHLTESNAILRRVDDHRNVFYQFNSEKLEYPVIRILSDEDLKLYLDETYNSKPADIQVREIARISGIRGLEILKREILLELNQTFENKLKLSIVKNTGTSLEQTVFDKCLGDTKYREEIFQAIDHLEKSGSEQP
jgi:DNA-binding transcriptional ArsR family regulator